MLISRKLFKALAVTGLLTLGSISSFAQATCTGPMTTTNLGVRPEGLTELSGDIKVTCVSTGSPAVQSELPTDFSVLVQLTNGVDVVNTTSTNPTFLVDGAVLAPANLSISYPAGIPNAISFQVNAIPAGATNFEINGIRINANKAQIAGVTSVQATLIATTIISGGTTVLPIQNNPSLVATILPKSLNFSVIGGTNANSTSASGSLATCIANDEVSGFFRFTENFSNVLRTVQPGVTVPTLPTPSAYNEEGPNANNGTHLRVVLSGLPANVTVLVPNQPIVTGNNVLIPVSGISSTATDVDNFYQPYTGAGSTNQVDAGGGVVAGSGAVLSGGSFIESQYGGTYGAASSEIVYRVQTIIQGAVDAPAATTSSVASLDAITIPFVASFAGGPSVGIGAATAKGTLAPIGGTSVVRFADNGDSAQAFATNICSTTLLFPYVTTDAGFDTGLAISNTTADPSQYGTANQVGSCSLNPYGEYSSGATVPAAGTSPEIAAGRTWAFSLTDSPVFDGAGLGSGFNGYLIAVCDFQLAHGYAFISTYGLSGANAVANGYLALVIEEPTGSRSSVLGERGAETLGN